MIDGQLVGAVAAVFGLVADPGVRNAAGVVAAEQTRQTVLLVAAALVRAVGAVVDAVADLERQRAVEVVALELARPTVTHRYVTRTHTHIHTHAHTYTHIHTNAHTWFTTKEEEIRMRTLWRPRAGSGVERIDPIRFLAGCRKSRLNQALSVLSFSLGFFSECVYCAVNYGHFLRFVILCYLCVLSLGCSC